MRRRGKTCRLVTPLDGTDDVAPARPMRSTGAVAGSARPPNISKPDQAKPSKNAWIYLVLFVRIGTFQWVTAFPNRKFSLPRPCRQAPRKARAFFSDHRAKLPWLPIFTKELFERLSRARTGFRAQPPLGLLPRRAWVSLNFC